VFDLLHEEIPYKTAVDIEMFREEEKKNLIVVNAVIYIDREAHKRIIIGKGGSMLKKIGTRARKDMEHLLGAKVFLEIFVKVKKGWSSSESMLRELGIDQQ
jgi:GTP-binding protein Era